MPGVLVQGQTVIIVHRTLSGRDSYGNDTYSETQETVSYCSVHPGLTTEVFAGTDVTTADVTVYLPDGTAITALDAMILPDGNLYEVEGKPNQWQSPFTGIRSFVAVAGRLVTGGST